jgi:hypothetical protein
MQITNEQLVLRQIEGKRARREGFVSRRHRVGGVAGGLQEPWSDGAGEAMEKKS